MKTYQLLLLDDGRPVNEWGIPIGPSYEKKDWGLLTPDEMKADFEWKSDILAALAEEVDGATFYQDYLFYDLYNGLLDSDFDYKVMLTEYDGEVGSKVHKVDVDEIDEYLHLNDVALSPCLFWSNWRRKDLLNYVGAFVLDIDKLRPMHLQRFFKLFEEGRLLTPTFIANSGSGVHFYYVLDKMLKVDSVNNGANNLIAEEIYNRLYADVIKKEHWRDAQRHWLGQDYRVVNSRTKLNLVSQIFKIGEVYPVEELIEYYDIKQVKRKKRYASKAQIDYATNIAKDLKIEVPDFEDYAATSEFIKTFKDEAYKVRVTRRELREQKEKKTKKKKQKKTRSWYRDTLAYMHDNTRAGYRFSSMKALAVIARVESVTREKFVADIKELAAYWGTKDWNGDNFNQRNVEAIFRFFDQKYKAKPETLEEWLGYEFKRIGVKRNDRSREVHLKLARNQLRMLREIGETSVGRPLDSGTKKELVKKYIKKHPEASVTEIANALGVSRTTVYKWKK